MNEIQIRLFGKNDLPEALTDLIHRAYRQLADMGFRYWGTHQTVEDTQKRISGGECFVALLDSEIAGTILLIPPEKTGHHRRYDHPNVASFHQFAVDPLRQKQGIGSKLLETIEKRAAQLGATELACDTAEGAGHLIRFYQKRGFRQVDTADWEITNYKSIILSKTVV